MTTDSILVNGVEIEKSVIHQLLKEKRKMEAIKLLCETAKISLWASKHIVELFQKDLIEHFDYRDIVELERREERRPLGNKESKLGKRLMFLGGVILVIFLFLNYVVGFNHIPHHWESLVSNGFSFSTDTEADADTAMVYTMAALDADEVFYPIDTTWSPDPETKALDVEKVRGAHFENLEKAVDSPTDLEAQRALIVHTEGNLLDAIKNENIEIQIGQCYQNPNLNGTFTCVSCMIMLYDTERGDFVSAPQGDNYMKTAYDFYVSSEGDIWDARDLSMSIPYDYSLFGRYSTN